MPSGSKKRKAAKKKKEILPNSHQDPSSLAPAQSHGSDDVRHQDGKESDVGEVSSPVSQDPHSHQNPLTEGEGEVIQDEKIIPTDGGGKIEAVNKSVIAVEEVNVFSVGRDIGIEDDSSKQDGRFEHKEATKRSYDGGSSRSSSSSSSSSSSDDESHGIKSSQAVEDIAPVVDSTTVTHSLSESKVEMSNSVAIEDAGDSVVQAVTVVPDKVLSLDQKAKVDSSSLDNSVALSPVKANVVISTTSKSTALELKEEASIQSIEKNSKVSDPKECVLQTTDDQLIVSYNAPVTAENGADNVVESGVTEPVVQTAPRPVQMTSWKSCCGLFEVFTGSG